MSAATRKKCCASSTVCKRTNYVRATAQSAAQRFKPCCQKPATLSEQRAFFIDKLNEAPMEFLASIKALVPDYAKDIRLNLDGTIARSSLEGHDAVGVALAAAFAGKSTVIVDAIR